MNGNTVLLIGFGVLLLLTNGVTAYKTWNISKAVVMADWKAADLAREKATAEANEKVITTKKKVKHENQNRDRDALIRHVCSRGWVREPEQCKPYRR